MPLFNQTTIVGVGLIGGSLAKAIKKNKLSNKIVGFFRNTQKLNKAIREKIVDKGFLDIKESIRGSDLIVLALPINQIIKFMPKIKKNANKKTIIIDMGSTKVEVDKAARNLRLNFVGTHPLAGSEKKGISSSTDKLFDKSKVIITPTNKTNKKSLDKIKTFWKRLNANVILLSPEKHDKILSRTSHLPHVVAFSLVNSIPDKFLNFGASGLKDITRIALSDPEIWSDIFLSNKKEVLHAVNDFEKKIKQIKKAISRNQRKQLIQILNMAKNKRNTIEN